MAEPSLLQTRLARELMRLRDLAGLSGREMGRRIGLSQSQVSRIDRGVALPSLATVRSWLDQTRASVDDRERVLGLVEAAHGETRPWSSLFASAAHLQALTGERDRSALLIRNYQPTILPGLLQTAAYARAALRMGRTTDIPAAVAARMERQQVLHEPGRRFEFVIAERLLTWDPGDGALAGQEARLLSLASEPTIDIRVLPDATNPGVLAWHNFVLRTDGSGVVTASAELVHGSIDDSSEPERVAAFDELWTRLWDAAVQGDAAIARIRGAKAAQLG